MKSTVKKSTGSDDDKYEESISDNNKSDLFTKNEEDIISSKNLKSKHQRVSNPPVPERCRKLIFFYKNILKLA